MPFFGVSNKRVSLKRRSESTVNFDNLITIPTQTASPYESYELTMALFNDSLSEESRKENGNGNVFDLF